MDKTVYCRIHELLPYLLSSKMLGLFISKKQAAAPAIIPTDTVIPLNAADDTDVLRSVCVVLSYRFDDVLDPEKLRRSFERLLDRPGWRKIGGRLRLNVRLFMSVRKRTREIERWRESGLCSSKSNPYNLKTG